MSILNIDYLVATYIFSFFNSLVPKIDICLKYFLDKNSYKQPLCLVSGIINLVKSLMCQISNPTFILEEFSRIDNRFVSLLKFSVAAVILLFFQWKFGKMVFRGTMGANLSWIITFNWIGTYTIFVHKILETVLKLRPFDFLMVAHTSATKCMYFYIPYSRK